MTDTTGTQGRLVALKMVMENFKSYAGIREIGPFHKSFTSIVGPNGSGKSNVIDAIQFVFGKKQHKLRLKKMSELIHNSEQFQDLTHASVAVHFAEIIDHKDDDGFDIVPGSEMVVKRSVNKKSVSKYYINNTVSTWEEVTATLKEKHIDLDNNRFLILQGEVEQISLMKPKAPSEHEDGLLEYVEDIIGTRHYVEKIEAAYEAVEQLTDDRTRKVAVLKGAEREKNNLQEAKNEAEDYLIKKGELLKNQHVLTQIHLQNAQDKLEEQSEKKQEVQQQYDVEKQKLDTKTQDLKEYDEKVKAIRKETDKLQADHKKAKSEFATFERQDIELKEELKSIRQKKQNLEKEVETSQEKIEELKGKITRAERDEKNAQEQLDKVAPQLEHAEYTAEQIYKSVQSEIEPLRVEKEKLQKKLLPMSKKIHDTKHKVDVSKSEIGLLKEKSDSIQTQYDEAKTNLTKRKEEVEAKIKEKSNLTNVKKSIEERIPKLEEELASVTEKERELAEKYQRSRSSLENMNERNRSAKDSGALLREVLKARDNGDIDGIIDRLGNLGRIAKKYDVAISTACGQLNHIVVENTESAKRVIEFIKKNNLGTTTCIILDRIATEDLSNRMKSKFTAPEGVPRLFDLVDPSDDRYKIAFYHALRNTLVAEDLDQASRIGYGKQKFRVVTLKGELIEESGTMTGGGAKIASGGMNTSSEQQFSAKDIKKSETEVKQLLQELTELRTRKDNITQQLNQLKQEVIKVGMAFDKANMDMKALQKQCGDLNKTIKDLEPRLNDTDAMEDTQIEDLEEKLEKYQKELKDAERESKSVEEEIKSLQHKIETAGGEKLKSQRAKVELFSQQRDELTSKLNRAQVQRETSQKNIEKAEKKFKESEQELSTIDDQVKKLKERAKELEAEAEPLYNAMVNTESAMKIKEQEKESLEEEFGSVKKEIEKLRATVEVELKTQLDELIKTEQECNKQIKKRTAQLEEYQKQVDELNADFMDEETPVEAQQATDAMAVDEEATKPINEDGMDVDEEAPKPAPQLPTGRFILKTYDAKALSKMKVDKISYDITMLLSTLETLKPDMAAIAQYREKERDYNARLNEVEAMTQARNNKQKEYEDMRKQRLDEFMKGFSGITMKLKEIYQTITLGGDAELELVDSLDPFSEGIVFSVRPPRKSWKNISNLSGGEKTLSSLALVFALHHFKPTPIYVMDEIDAALDFKNVSIVGNYIKEQTKNAQFIIISLRNNMFELADILVGIYKTDNCTKSVTIDPRKVAQTQQLRLQKQVAQTPSKRVTQTPARQPFQPRNI